MEMPYFTGDLPGVGGRTREALEDFRVEEIPLYEPSGSGTHVYFRVAKAGIPTPAAIERIARYMGVRPREIGGAGLKDARAVTLQSMSLEHADAAKLAAYRDSQLRVVETRLHTNKLRPGHLAGNRFTILIRGVSGEQLGPAQAVLDVLIRRGVPNYFGPQRFGARGDTDQLGMALIRQTPEEFLSLYLGRPDPKDPPDCYAARDAFDAGDYEGALSHWPRHYSNERRALAAYRKGRRSRRALAAIDRRMMRFFVSAAQSALFNQVLAGRIAAIDRVEVGDLAQKTDTGGVFPVEDLEAEQARAMAFEISPTGPIVGYQRRLAEGQPGDLERQVLATADLDPEAFGRLGALKAKGARRALRFRLDQPSLTADSDKRGQFLRLAFVAPSGCYASIVLREIMKERDPPG